MNAWAWDIKKIKKAIKEYEKAPKKKFIFTDSREDFIERLEAIAVNSVGKVDNLRYLEQLDKIRQLREGAALEDVFPIFKRDKKE